MLTHLIFYLILSLVVFQTCTSKNIIQPLNGLMFAHLNMDYTLICHWGPGTTIEWMDSQGNFIDIRFNCQQTGSKTTQLYQNTITYCDYAAKTSTLQIKNITEAQNGTKIKCITDDKEEEFTIKVSKKIDPTHFLMITSSKKEVYDGEDVEIRCQWNVSNLGMEMTLKCGDEKQVSSEQAILKLTMTKEWNKKHCTCSGFLYGTQIVAHHQITVYTAPQVQVNNLTVKAGTSAVLNCSASGGYPETYTYLEWHHFFNKVLLEKRQPSNENGSLILPNTTWQDAGTWICFVTNGKYNKSHFGYLTITGPPILQALSPNIEVSLGSNQKLEVQIFPFSGHDIVIKWLHNGRKVSKGTPAKFSTAWQQKILDQEIYVSGLTVSLTLNDINEKDKGNYSVVVTTKDGTSLYTFQMRILSKSNISVMTIGLICGSLVIIVILVIIGCIFCSQRQRYHATIIDSMNTPRTRIFSVPKNDSLNYPTSNLELDIYEEIDDFNGNDFKKEDGYLNPSVVRYS